MGALDNIMAFVAPTQYEALRRFQDQSQAGEDLALFQKDPTYRIDPSKYNSPETGLAIDNHLKGLREFKQQEAANPVLDKFATDYSNLAGPDKRFFADPESRAVLEQSGLQLPESTGNPYVRKGIEDFKKQAQLENDLADNFANPGDVNSLARLGANPLAQAQHNIVGTLQTSQDKAATRDQAAAKEAAASQVKQDISGFQNDIAGLTGPSTSPNDLARFAKRGGYAPFTEVESDIRQAAAARGVGDSPEVNKAVTDARSLYEKTMLPPQTVQVGRTTATGQTNLLGDFRKDVTSTAPVVKVAVSTGAAGTPSGIALLAKQVVEGRRKLESIGTRGGNRDNVAAYIEANYPGTDLAKLGANIAYQQAPGNLQSRALIQGVEPLYDNLLEAGKALGNSSIPGVNKIKNWVKEATGQPEIVAFNNLRDDVIAESERVLMGSGVLSDSKYTRAVNNVKSSASMPQLNAAVRQLRLTVKSRLEALDKQPFPTSGSKPAAQAPTGPQKIGKYTVEVH
jgi:hypothetical protein